MFGYGFGFVGVILLMMQEIAPGKYQTAHYAFANSLMNLGLMIPGTVSGKIQMALGYRKFFIWVLLSSIPAMILARMMKPSPQGDACDTAILTTHNREYVIERPDVPVSWTNYLGVRDLCTVISHNAGGYSFYSNAEHQRITRFRANGVPLDRPGHYVYLRDDETGEYWSISWQPVGKDLKKARVRVPPRTVVFQVLLRLPRHRTPSRRSSSRSKTTWSCGTCGSATRAPRRAS